MRFVENIADLKQIISELNKTGKSIGFVPTMGALHAGHISLIKQAVSENDFCVVSIFVNPTQFNNKKDLEKYPRNIDKDCLLLNAAGCDLVFCPSAEEMYSKEEIESTFKFDFAGLDKVMEGKFRQGHFNGVVQVVSKLFSLVMPDKAYFGEKDFQQLAIIHHLVKSANMKISIIDCPIVREADGLAMSSRNERLNAEERKNATGISAILMESRTFATKLLPEQITEWVIKKINEAPGLQLEYFEIVDVKSLQKVTDWSNPSIGCIAVFCGDIRLIDNIRY